MQKSRINYAVVGACVSVLAVALLVAAAMMVVRTDATDKYFTVYDSVGGLKFGTQVYYEGYQIGQVQKIEPIESRNNQVQFKVDIEVKAGWKIPDDSMARASVSGLLSGRAIEIRAGKSATVLRPGAQIQGAASANMFAALQDISSRFSELSDNSIKPFMANLNRYSGLLGDSTINHLPKAMADLETVAARVEDTLNLINTQAFSPSNAQHLDTTVANFETASENLAALSTGLKDTRKVFEEAQRSVKSVIENNTGNMNAAARELNYTLDMLSRYADDVTRNTDAAARDLKEATRAVKKNPGLLINNTPHLDPTQGAKE